jgi:addiction module RelE/StbE family toxin
MKVFWTDKATSHLLSIYEYIQQDSPIYAEKLLDKLISRSEQIASFPYSGRKVPEYDAEHIREIFEGKYRIIYRVNEDAVDILAVIHGVQQLPPDL